MNRGMLIVIWRDTSAKDILESFCRIRVYIRTRSPFGIRESSRFTNYHSLKMALDMDSILFYEPFRTASSSSNCKPLPESYLLRHDSVYWPPPQVPLPPKQEMNNITHGVSQSLATPAPVRRELLRCQGQVSSNIPDWHEGIP